MMILSAAALSLVPVNSDDVRLGRSSTFVSPDAQASLAEDSANEILCLNRPRSSLSRYRNICLTETEWTTAIKVAEAAPKRGPKAFFPNSYTNPDLGQGQFGLSNTVLTAR